MYSKFSYNLAARPCTEQLNLSPMLRCHMHIGYRWTLHHPCTVIPITVYRPVGSYTIQLYRTCSLQVTPRVPLAMPRMQDSPCHHIGCETRQANV